MDKKKILFITPSLCQGGIEHSQIIMLQLLDKARYDMTLFLYRDDVTLLPMVPKEVTVIMNNDKSHYFRRPKAVLLSIMAKVYGWLGFGKKHSEYSESLREYIHDQKTRQPAKDYFHDTSFDVVVSNAIGICTEMALHVNARRHIVWYRASVDMHHDMLKRVFPLYDAIIAVSAGVKEMLCRAYPEMENNITVIEDFVDGQAVIEKSKLESVFPAKHFKGKMICSCGRFTAEKGFDMAIEAARILQQRGMDFVWYFIGDGSDRAELEKKIDDLGLTEKIVITGFMDNPFPLMKQCDIYVQPSYEEAFGRTIKEALVLGKTVVSTATAGGKTILQNGKLGILTSIDANGLANGILDAAKLDICRYTMEMNNQEKVDYISALEYMFS